MARAALPGVDADTAPPQGDAVNALASGLIASVGPTQPSYFRGPLNLSLYASYNTALTTTQGSLAATVAAPGTLAAGAAVNGANVPPGTTVGAISGSAVTLALPTVTLRGKTTAGSNVLAFMPEAAANLVGAAVTGPGIAPGTTVTSVVSPAVPGAPTASGSSPFGSVTLSQPATASEPTHPFPNLFNFALGPQAIKSGVDTSALFTGAGITYSGAVQLERSFDGGQTYIVGNSGGAGALAQFPVGTPVSLSFTEMERNVLYRLNCTAFTPQAGIVLNYRLSQTSGAAESLSLN